MTETRKLRVFLCHSSQDKPIVRELYQRLNAAPQGGDKGWIEPWLDKEKLLPGQEWELEIEKSVEISDAVVVCLSKSSVGKEGYFQKEIKKVLDLSDQKPEGTIFIIPLRLDDCKPPRRLAKWQYVDYFPEENKNQAFAQLLQSLMLRGKSLGIEFKQFMSDVESTMVGLGLERVVIESPQPTKNSNDEKIVPTPVRQRKTIPQSHRSDHHSALVSEQVSEASGAGVKFVMAKLQWGKDDFGYSLHAEPSSFSSYGMQTTDFLNLLGFRREDCSFVSSRECFTIWVDSEFEVSSFARKFDESYSVFEKATRLLESCGHFVDQPEGWGYYRGKPSSGKSNRSRLGYSADGHKGNKTELLKQTEDDNFSYRMSWIESGSEKGWVFHYRLKNQKNNHFLPVLEFLGLRRFSDCPYFEFEECNWMYFQHENRGDSFFESNASFVHGFFGAHEKNFSSALNIIVDANELVKPFGFHFLKT